MRLFRFGDPGKEKSGVILENNYKVDVSGFGEDFNEAFFASQGIERLEKWLMANSDNCPKVSDNIRLGSAVARPSKIVCIGLNFADHARERMLKSRKNQ